MNNWSNNISFFKEKKNSIVGKQHSEKLNDSKRSMKKNKEFQVNGNIIHSLGGRKSVSAHIKEGNTFMM